MIEAATIVIKTIDIGSIMHIDTLLGWLIVGLIAGFLANVFVRGRSLGCLGNILVGLIGSFIGALLASALDIGNLHFCGSVFVSFIGAAIFLAIVQLFTGKRH